MEYAQENQPKPKEAASMPVEVKLEAGKTYAWCTCGLSETQPFCDGKHKSMAFEKDGETILPFKSLKYTAEKDETLWWCQCKHTKNPPFCDGAHNRLGE